jgi:hypothetical protein
MRILDLFRRRPTKEQILIGKLIEMQEVQLRLIIALARLLFTSPKALQRESKNTQKNAEYIIELTKAQNVPQNDS